MLDPEELIRKRCAAEMDEEIPQALFPEFSAAF